VITLENASLVFRRVSQELGDLLARATTEVEAVLDDMDIDTVLNPLDPAKGHYQNAGALLPRTTEMAADRISYDTSGKHSFGFEKLARSVSRRDAFASYRLLARERNMEFERF
jgi:hypothetical protein